MFIAIVVQYQTCWSLCLKNRFCGECYFIILTWRKVPRKVIGKHLKAIGMVQKQGTWVFRHDKVNLLHENATDLMLRKSWKLIWKRWNGKFCPTRHIHRTLLHLIIIFSDAWRMACQSSTSKTTTWPKIGSTHSSNRKKNNFFDAVSELYQKDGKKL